MLAKSLAVQIQQTMAVPVFVPAHFSELVRLLRVGICEAFDEIVINASVLLLLRNGQGEDLPFGEAVE
jgi:hypothetical protein